MSGPYTISNPNFTGNNYYQDAPTEAPEANTNANNNNNANVVTFKLRCLPEKKKFNVAKFHTQV